MFHVDDVNDSDELDDDTDTSDVMFDDTDTCTNDDGCDVRRTPKVADNPHSLVKSPVDPTSTRPASSASETVPFTPHADTARDSYTGSDDDATPSDTVSDCADGVFTRQSRIPVAVTVCTTDQLDVVNTSVDGATDDDSGSDTPNGPSDTLAIGCDVSTTPNVPLVPFSDISDGHIELTVKPAVSLSAFVTYTDDTANDA